MQVIMQFQNKFYKIVQTMLLVGVLMTLTGCSNGNTGTVSAGVDPMDYTFESQQIKEEITPTITAGIEIPGYDTLYIDYDADVMEGDFFNPENNNVYFRISFYLTKGDVLFYQSNLIEPSQHLYRLEMLETFARGSYDMYIVYESFTTDGTFAPRNGATVNCVLVVE